VNIKFALRGGVRAKMLRIPDLGRYQGAEDLTHVKSYMNICWVV
jgi:hypothetical protein